MSQPNPLLDLMERYGPTADDDAIVRYATELCCMESLDPWEIEFFRAFKRGERAISVSACHGPGKTAKAAVCIGWSILFRYPQVSVATAPTKGQLEGALMREVIKWIRELPEALQAMIEVKARSIHLRSSPDMSKFEIRTARAESPEALQGIHEDAGWVHLWVDEASGVHEKIFESAGGSMSGHNCQTVMLSNPTRTSGFFYRSQNQDKESWFTIQVGWKDSSRVSDLFEQEMAMRYGKDSNAYRVRVLGLFPLSDMDTIIPFEFIEGAQNRDIVVPPNLTEVWGLDVARYGGDLNVLVRRNNIAVLDDIEVWDKQDLMYTVNRVHNKWNATAPHERPTEILVDVIGLGAGVVDRLIELGLPTRGVNVGEGASSTEKYTNLRTELWFDVREWLMKKDRRLPVCDINCGCADRRECPKSKLGAELGLLKYEYTASGKIKAESKDNVKKRGFKSPNIADAVCLTFAGTAAGIIHGSQGSSGFGGNWNEPVQRNRPVV